MRSILVDWLVDVHLKFKLLQETLFLTINIIDRYLEKVSISKQSFQLLGITAMYLACKYEEVYFPEAKDFIYVTDNAYTKNEMLELEGKIIKKLEFNFNQTSSLRFLERYENLFTDFNERKKAFSRLLLELSLINYNLVRFPQSLKACASLYIVNKLEKNKSPWNWVIEKESRFSEEDILICAREMFKSAQNAPKSSLDAINRKYSNKKYFEVFKLVQEKLN